MALRNGGRRAARNERSRQKASIMQHKHQAEQSRGLVAVSLGLLLWRHRPLLLQQESEQHASIFKHSERTYRIRKEVLSRQAKAVLVDETLEYQSERSGD